MLADLDLLDVVILGGATLIGGRIAWFDFRSGYFPLHLWLSLTAVGFAWCVKQGFWPMAVVPLSLGVAILGLINRFGREVIGEGDLLLFLTTGLFIPLCELDRFFIIAGCSGIALALPTKCHFFHSVAPFPRNAFPFSGALLAAMFCTLLCSLCS